MKKAALITAGVVAALAVGCAMSLRENTEMTWGVLIVVTGVLSAGAALLSVLRMRAKGSGSVMMAAWALGAAVATFFLTVSAAIIINYHTACASDAQVEEMRVCSLRKTTKHRPRRIGRRGVASGQVPYDVFHMFVVDSRGDTLSRRITKEEYRRLRRGDIVRAREPRGIFGWRVLELD